MNNPPSTRSFTLAHAIYGFIFLVALFLRLFRLGLPPLNDGEAFWALQALDFSQGQLTVTSAQPGYTVLTGLLFFLIDTSNVWSRLLPALAGSLLVLLPLIIRPSLPDTPWLRRAGLLLAVALAIDPALVGLSRQAGSLMTSLSFSLLALALWISGHRISAGILAGLAILSGPGLLHGLLGLSIALVIAGFLKQVPFHNVIARSEAAKQSDHVIARSEATKQSLSNSNPLLLYFLLTILLVGSGFGLYPRGLAGLAETLGAYIQTWIPGSTELPGQPLASFPMAILLYQPLAVIFGLVSGVRSWLPQENGYTSLGRFLGIWVIASFVLVLLTPNRQVIDLAWTLIPLWALAALEISRYTLPLEWSHQGWVFQGAALLFAFFIVLGGYYLLYLNTMGVQPPLQAAMMAGIGAMALIVALLFAAGWSISITRIGLVWGISAVLALWMLSPTWGLSQLRPNGAAEFWHSGSAAGQVDLLTSTLRDLAAWDTSITSLLEIHSTVDSPSLRWALRDIGPVTFSSGLAWDQLPAAFITPESTQSPELLASYRGQDFEWEVFSAWNGPLPPNLLQWLYLRKAPVTSQKIILWVRSDIFPGGELQP